MKKFITDNRNLCWALAHNVRNFASRSFRQIVILILFITVTVLTSMTSLAYSGDQADINTIHLKKRQFVPQASVKQKISKITGHAIIQFEKQPDDSIISILTSHQINVLEWVPRNAVMAYIPETAQVEAIPGIRWIGKINPTDKISDHLNKSLTKGFMLVDFYPDVTDRHARSVISKGQGKIIENSYLAPKTYLVRATEKIAAELSTADEVSWIWPASDAIINGEPVHYCPGPMTASGLIVPNYVAHDDGWDGPGKGSASLKYYFGTGTSDTTGEETEVADAFNEWAKYVDITFTRTSTPNQTQSIDFFWGTGSHGCDYPFEPGVLAHGFFPHPFNDETIAGDIHFNDDYSWRTSCSSSYEFDVYTVALHEAGHSLGLGHSSIDVAVMYPYLHENDCYTVLQQDDIDGIRSIYGNSRACGACEPVDSILGIQGTIGTVPWRYRASGHCGRGGKWVGRFVGEANATYHFDLCPDSPGSGINHGFDPDPDIKITDSSCKTILGGDDGSCSSPTFSPNDFQWTCSANGTYYVIIAPYPSYGSHTCTGTASSTFTLKYYKEGILNLSDFAIFAFYWMDDTCSDPNWCEGNDFDCSGSVDMLDLATFAGY